MTDSETAHSAHGSPVVQDEISSEDKANKVKSRTPHRSLFRRLISHDSILVTGGAALALVAFAHVVTDPTLTAQFILAVVGAVAGAVFAVRTMHPSA